MSAIHPDQVLEQLLAKGNRKDKDERLRKLHEICAVEYKGHSSGARDMSLPNIGRIAESHQLFKARSLYNEQSKDYVTLIEAWEVYSGPLEVTLQKTKPKSWEEKYPFVDSITDPAVRGMCLATAAERDRLTHELNTLKAQVSRGLVVHLGSQGAQQGTAPKAVTVQTTIDYLPHERRALEAALSEAHLNRFRLKLAETGEVLNERGECVFPPGFAQAIRRALGQEPHRVINQVEDEQE